MICILILLYDAIAGLAVCSVAAEGPLSPDDWTSIGLITLIILGLNAMMAWVK
jgi:hypothetical protein